MELALRKILVLLLLMPLAFTSCDNDEDQGPPDEEFMGLYMVRDKTEVIDMAKIDSVIFSIQKNMTYQMDFYKSSPTDRLVDFCYCEGTLIDFGTAKVSFDPTFINKDNCDTLRIPRGLFEADFRTLGDTVYIERKNTLDEDGQIVFDSLFQLKLIKTK